MIATQRQSPIHLPLEIVPRFWFNSNDPSSPSSTDFSQTVKPSSTAPNAEATSSKRPFPSRTERRFKCTFEGCDKAYTKPTRLLDHERSHTGLRPHACPHCDQTYLRASHLTAHLRTHLSDEDRRYACSRDDCNKRFWTATHLKRHEKVHDHELAYKCEHCSEAFTKSHQLRDHVVLAHMPAGTKPYLCLHEGCGWSFALKAHLTAHEKTHDPSRYTCSHPTHTDLPTFPNWSALQKHLRDDHPPSCPHAECDGRVFKTAQRLKEHLKQHAGVDAVPVSASEAESDAGQHSSRTAKRGRLSGTSVLAKAAKQRRMCLDEVENTWACDHVDCTRSFKTKLGLAKHRQAMHRQQTPLIAPHSDSVGTAEFGRSVERFPNAERVISRSHEGDEATRGIIGTPLNAIHVKVEPLF